MNKWLWIISTQIPAGALVLKVHEILEKNNKKKKTAKNYNKSDLVFKINFTPVVTFVSFS